MNNKVILAFSTCPNETAGRELARSIVKNRLAACVNVLPGIGSVYRWQGEILEDSECLLVIKTTGSRFEALEQQIAELHPYELPELVAVPVTAGLPAYLEWVDAETRTDD